MAKLHSRSGLTRLTKHLPPLDCGSCTACCMNGQLLSLLPGDDPSLYKTETIYPPDDPDGAGILCLETRKDSKAGCIYCEGGCTIYETRPRICRTFDCRELILINTKQETEEALREGLFTEAIVQAGRDRLRKYRRSLP